MGPLKTDSFCGKSAKISSITNESPLSLRKQIRIAQQLSQTLFESKLEVERSLVENLVERRVCDERLKKLKRNYKGETILHQAAIKGDSDSIFHLLYRERKSKYFQKCLVDIEDNAGWTPLHEACLRGNYKAAKSLILFGANVNARSKCGTTALIDAAGNGHLEVVELLLENGADPSIVNSAGKTALGAAKDHQVYSLLHTYLDILTEHHQDGLEHLSMDSSEISLQESHEVFNNEEILDISTEIKNEATLDLSAQETGEEVIPTEELAELDFGSESSLRVCSEISDQSALECVSHSSNWSYSGSELDESLSNNNNCVSHYLSYLPLRKRYLLHRKEIDF